MHPLGLYLAIPFCRAKCTFCNFASDAFAPTHLPAYIDRLTAEIASARTRHPEADLPQHVDTLYFGGGTPSLLSPQHLRSIFAALHTHFRIDPSAEITVECAPGQLHPATLDELLRQGVNRLSFGVQSFDPVESAAIGRLHTPDDTLRELDRVRSAGLHNLSLDLIAGLPHQTRHSWRASVETAISTGVPHISIYMLEVDEDSRLGREVLSAGPRYGAPSVPTDDQATEFYEIACDLLERAGILQYEISNFAQISTQTNTPTGAQTSAQTGFQSAHNRKYWQRQPYLGLGLDAHSMLQTPAGPIRFSNTDDLDTYLAPQTAFPRLAPAPHRVTPVEQIEEALFLGLRLNEGVSLQDLAEEFGQASLTPIRPALEEVAEAGLLTLTPDRASLTPHGRLLSNEVFSRLLLPSVA